MIYYKRKLIGYLLKYKDVMILKNGILVINKPKGITSRQVVDQAGKALNTRKVGHTGTLDPLAEGVLVLGINQGTKIIDLLTSVEKEYIAEVVIGQDSDTLDVTGNVRAIPTEEISLETIKKTLNSFLGSYDQEVPIYSAVHVEGKRLYEYARENQEVKLPSREVTIKEIELLGAPYWEDGHEHFKFRVVVSKGTYIRSLIRDIGRELATPCIMKNLKRTRQGNFILEQSIDLESIKEESQIIKIEDALTEYDKIVVNAEIEEKIKNGRILTKNFHGKYVVVVNENQQLLAIYQTYDKDETLMKPWKVFPKEEE